MRSHNKLHYVQIMHVTKGYSQSVMNMYFVRICLHLRACNWSFEFALIAENFIGCRTYVMSLYITVYNC